eukprot:gene19343-23129_t
MPRIPSPARGVLAGVRKDAEKAKQERLTGEVTREHGNAWSHGYLNQKTWHPLSYRNQRLLYMAEEKSAKQASRDEQAKEDFARESEFFQAAELLSSKDRERVTDKQALSFMYQKPPGYEEAMERDLEEQGYNGPDGVVDDTNAENAAEARPKKTRDMYGRAVPTEKEFAFLKGAPKEESAGADARVKPFAKEVKMIWCSRCECYGHSSRDRECPKAAENPNDVFRQRIEDPLTLLKARAELAKGDGKFQLKVAGSNVSGRSPDAENQQILGLDEEEPLGNDANILDSLPKKERKRLIKEYMKKEKKLKRKEREAQKEAAEAYLLEAGVKSKKRKKDSKDSKDSKKSKKHKKSRRSKASSESSSSSSSEDE